MSTPTDKLKPSNITEEVNNVLTSMRINTNGRGRSYLTAYQILELLPLATRDRLINERGNPGLGGGKYYGPTNVVSDAAEMLSDIVEIVFLDTTSLNITWGDGTDITPSNKTMGLYRLKE